MINLPDTDLNVSEICLGTVTFGNRLGLEESFTQLDHFTEHNNFIDTARVYGNSESVIGAWLKDRRYRDKVIIASKGAHPDMGEVWTSRISKDNICYDLDLSLKTLNTEYIDLYFLHRDDKTVPVCEIIGIMEDLRKTGKIRYYGCSNWTTKRIKEAQLYAESIGCKGFVSNQVMLSLTKANEEIFKQTDMVQADEEMIRFHEESRMSLMSYMALAGGYFSKLMDNRKISDSANLMYNNESNKKRFNVIRELCQVYGYTTVDLLLHYVTLQSYPAIPVVAFSNIKQMDEIFLSLGKRIEKEHIDLILKD